MWMDGWRKDGNMFTVEQCSLIEISADVSDDDRCGGDFQGHELGR
jgi:hypothetical protein